jgi:hypothetical protein
VRVVVWRVSISTCWTAVLTLLTLFGKALRGIGGSISKDAAWGATFGQAKSQGEQKIELPAGTVLFKALGFTILFDGPSNNNICKEVVSLQLASKPYGLFLHGQLKTPLAALQYLGKRF